MTTDPKNATPLRETQDYLAEVIAERDKLRAELLGMGAQCSTCGFKYWEHKGHIIPCPVCELANCRAELERQQLDRNQQWLRAETAESHYTDLLSKFENPATLLASHAEREETEDKK